MSRCPYYLTGKEKVQNSNERSKHCVPRDQLCKADGSHTDCRFEKSKSYVLHLTSSPNLSLRTFRFYVHCCCAHCASLCHKANILARVCTVHCARSSRIDTHTPTIHPWRNTREPHYAKQVQVQPCQLHLMARKQYSRLKAHPPRHPTHSVFVVSILSEDVFNGQKT